MRVFLSYPQPDRDRASALGARLREAGHEVWDPAIELVAGDNWALALGRALERSDAMVVLLSPEALASTNVVRDLEYALGEQRFEGRLVPVVVRPTDGIPWILERFPMVNADDGDAAERVIDVLRRAPAPSRRRKAGGAAAR